MPDTGYHLSLPTGTRIEEYQLVSVLGQGSFGITYLAEDTNLGARLAIKEYLPGDWAFRDATQTVKPKSTSLSESFEKGQDAFLKEARILARVTHPNIVKVRRFFRAYGTAYIAMDFVKGASLGDMLNQDFRSGGYPSAALKKLLVTILDGLSALHEAGIIHRDIKPGNIVIEPNGNPILVDFGAARNYDRTMLHGMTVIVTPGYAPIEQYSDDGEQGPFTDIYALGALAYRAITGQPPDPPYKRLGRNSSSVTASVAGAGKYPPALLSAIDWALEVQPHDRPQTAAALLARLREAPDELPAGSGDEPTRVLSDATQIVESSRFRGAIAPKEGSAAKEPVSRAEAAPPPPPQTIAPAPVPAVAAVDVKPAANDIVRPAASLEPQRRAARMPLVLASVAVLVLAGAAAAYFVAPSVFRTGPTADDAQQRAAEAAKQAAEAQAAAEAAKRKAEQEAAEAARQEAERQAAAKAEADRQAAAAAQLKAEQEAAAKAEADRQAAEAAKAKAEQDAAEAMRQAAAAKAEADRQAAAATAAKAKAEQQASAPATALDPEAAAAAREEAESAAAAEAEAAGVLKTKAEQDAARAAAKREADRKAAAAAKLKAEQQAAALARLRAQQDAGGLDAARQLLGTPTPGTGGLVVPSVRPIDPRCTTILQNTSLMGALSDADRLYLRNNCH